MNKRKVEKEKILIVEDETTIRTRLVDIVGFHG